MPSVATMLPSQAPLRPLLTAAIFACLVARGAPTVAQAGPASVEISWVRAQGAESCPAPARIRAEVLRRLGPARTVELGGHSVEAIVRGRPGAWGATIYVRAPDGSLRGVRPMASDAATCGPIATAATLAITLAIDPAVVDAAPAVLEPPPPPRAPAAPPPAPGEQTASAPAARRLPGASVSLQGLASVGVLSLAAPGVGLSAEWPVAPRVTLVVGALWLPEARRSFWTFGFGLTAGSAGLCLEAVRTKAISFGGCAHALAGALQAFAHGSEYVKPYNLGDRGWGAFAPAVRFGARPARPLLLTLGVEALVPFARYQLEPYATTDSIFRQPAVGGVAFGGVGITFGEGSGP